MTLKTQGRTVHEKMGRRKPVRTGSSGRAKAAIHSNVSNVM